MAVYRVGCAGWSYRDWVGPVYAPQVPANQWLAAYASLFPVVEIDATFYALPAASTVRGWVRKAQALTGFTFAAKLDGQATHEALPRLDAF